MKLRKINSHDETIEFLVFNYDGKGSALVIDNDNIIEKKSLNEVEDLILGEHCKEKEYEMI